MFYLEFALIGHIIHADKWEFCFGHDVCQSITYMKCERFWSSIVRLLTTFLSKFPGAAPDVVSKPNGYNTKPKVSSVPKPRDDSLRI